MESYTGYFNIKNRRVETDCVVLFEQGQYTRYQQQKITFEQFVSQLCTSYFCSMPVAENPLMLWLSVHHRCGNVKKVFHNDFVYLSKLSAGPRTCAEGNVILWWHSPILPVNDDNITGQNQTGVLNYIILIICSYQSGPGFILPAHIVLHACCDHYFLNVKVVEKVTVPVEVQPNSTLTLFPT